MPVLPRGRGVGRRSEATAACLLVAVSLLLSHDARADVPPTPEEERVLTRNYKDFEALHDLVNSPANGHHAGMLVVRYDNNPRNNMPSGDIARALRNLETSGAAIADSDHDLNHWQ
jgi:hypothetical protein